MIQQPVPISDYLLSADAIAFMDQTNGPRPAVIADRMSWYVLFVAPTARSVDRVQKFTERLGVETYWPKARRQKKVPVRKGKRGKRIAYKVEEVISSVLPRYVLVRLPQINPPFGVLTDDEAKFNGICGLVSTASHGEPTVIADQKVEEFRAREAAGEWEKLLPAKAPLGSVVQITDGPFALFNAVVEEWLSEERLKVSVNIFGRPSPIELEEKQVEYLPA